MSRYANGLTCTSGSPGRNELRSITATNTRVSVRNDKIPDMETAVDTTTP